MKRNLDMSNKKTATATKPETKKDVDLTKKELATYNSKNDQLGEVSFRIRYLNSLGWKRGRIAKFMGKRYQHVRNVLETPLKRVAT